MLIVSSAGHEANVGCWVRAAASAGAELLWWHPGGEHGEQTAPLDTLSALLASRPGAVRLVAVPQVSNLLGGIVDVAGAAALAHASGARLVVDSVAYAPHRRLRAAEWRADWCVWSAYKVYGPHAAVLYGASDAWAALRAFGAVPPNHFFIVDSGSADDAPWYPFEPGGPSHEAAAALCGVRAYLAAAAGGGDGRAAWQGDDSLASDVSLVTAAFDVFQALEAPVTALFAAFFASAHAAGRLRLLGPRGGGGDARVPTFSFVPSPPATPASVVAACHAARVALRHGHMYAPRLCERLGVEAAAGCVRVSAVHYNTILEARRAIDAIDAALAK